MMKNIKAVREEEKKAKSEQAEQMKALYQMVFGSEHGKKVLKDLAKFCGYGEDGFNSDQAIQSYKQGRQSTIIHIKKVLED